MQVFIEKLPNDNEKEKNIAFFEDITNQFNDIPDDLFVFFHANEADRAFLPRFYFYQYKNQFATTYNFQFLQNELSDQDKLIRNLIKFYFCKLDDEEIEQCATSSNRIFSQIKESNYSVEEKLKLYEFFMNPSRYIQLLQFQLIQKEFKLSEYYKNNYQTIIDLYNQTSFEELGEQLKTIGLCINGNCEALHISYCLLNKFHISLGFIKEDYMPLLGYEYMYMLGHNKKTDNDKELYNFAVALSEESRVRMLKLLVEKTELTCKDLEKEFNFSSSTAYHHISVMAKNGLVSTRNEGKLILYSLNKNCIKNIINTLSSFCEDEKMSNYSAEM